MTNQKKRRPPVRTSGFTLVEIMMVIALVGIVSAAAISMFTSSLDDAKFDATYKEMLEIRKALIGELSNTNIQGQRVRFGYFGDNGAIPTSSQGLGALVTQPSGAASWAINSSAKLGMGWNGPYMVVSSTSDYSTDAWGRAYIYNTVGTPYILSYGADGVAGGTGNNADIQIDLPVSLRTSTVIGQLLTSGSVLNTGAYVQVFYPSSTGTLSSQAVLLSTGNSGYFSFSSVPFGMRTVRVDIPTSTNPSFTLGPVEFPVDQANFYIPEHLLEINPATANTNCNNITNVSFTSGSYVKGGSTNRVEFQLSVRNAFSINTFYTNNSDTALGKARPVISLGINGVEYGCSNGKGWHKQSTIAASEEFSPAGCSSIDPNSAPNIPLVATWNIPSGTNMSAFMLFTGTTASMSWVDLKLGCDLMRLQ